MELVDEPHRHEDEARAGVDRAGVHVVDVGELHRDLAAGVFARQRVLVLDLGVEEPLVVELVAEVRDGAQEVDPVVPVRRGAVLPRVVEVLVEHLAVAADRDAPAHPVDLRGGKAEPVAFGGPLRVVGCAGAGAAATCGPAPAASPSFIDSISWARMSTFRSISARRASIAGAVDAAFMASSSARVSARSLSRRWIRSSGAAGVGVGAGTCAAAARVPATTKAQTATNLETRCMARFLLTVGW